MANINAAFVDQIFDLPQESGNRTYIISAKRMILDDVLKYRKGFFIKKRYETRLPASSQIPLTPP